MGMILLLVAIVLVMLPADLARGQAAIFYPAGIEGSSTVSGRERSSDLLGFSHDLSRPFDLASGRLTGATKHGALRITKRVDSASPALAEALASRTLLDSLVLIFYEHGSSSQAEPFYTVRIEGVRLSNITSFLATPEQLEQMGHSAQPLLGDNQLEDVSLTYDSIVWMYGDDISYETSRPNFGTPPTVTRGDELVPIALPPATVSTVHALATDPTTGAVYLSATMNAWATNDNGGAFRTDHLAVWDGEWSALGSINGVFSILPTSSDLYIGGSFQRATQDQAGCDPPPGFGDYPLYKVARLAGRGPCAVNEHDWIYEQVGKLSADAPHHVSALAIDEAGRIYAGGKGVIGSGHNFAVFDGSWIDAGEGFRFNGSFENAEVLAIEVHPLTEHVYVGGQFDEVVQPDGGVLEVSGIARWSGSQWEKVGGGLCDNCRASSFGFGENGDVYAGGRFASAINTDGEEVRVNNIAKWDGAAWNALGGGAPAGVTSNGITDIIVHDERQSLYIGGRFSQVENPGGISVEAHALSRWDFASETWHRLGDGLTAEDGEYVAALARFECTLYVGTNATEQHLYAYDACSVGSTGTLAGDNADLPANLVLEGVYPNPFNSATRVRYSLARSMHVRLTAFNVLGREVAVLVDDVQPAGSHVAVFAAEGRPSGIYLLQLVSSGSAETSTVLLVK